MSSHSPTRQTTRVAGFVSVMVVPVASVTLRLPLAVAVVPGDVDAAGVLVAAGVELAGLEVTAGEALDGLAVVAAVALVELAELLEPLELELELPQAVTSGAATSSKISTKKRRFMGRHSS